MDESINPKIATMKQETEQYDKFLNLKVDIQRLEKVKIAQDYLAADAQIQDVSKEEILKEKMKNCEQKMREVIEKKENCKTSIQNCENKEKDFFQEETACARELDVLERENKVKQERLNGLKAKLAKLNRQIDLNNRKVEAMQNQVEKSVSEADNIQEVYTEKEKIIEALRQEISQKEELLGEGSNLNDSMKSDLNEKKAECNDKKRIKRTLERGQNSAERQIKDKEKKIARGQGDWEKLTKDKHNIEARLQAVKNDMDNMPFDQERFQYLQQSERDLGDKIYQLGEQERRLQDSVGQFDYRAPRGVRDPSKVYGKVGSLIEVRDNEFVEAISAVAAGSLYSIVAEDNRVGKEIINNSRSRVHILPLQNLHDYGDSRHKLRRAQDRVGADNVWLAKDLVQFDPRFEIVMNQCFGHTFVTRTLTQAKDIAMNSNLQITCVSMDGDKADYRGIMEGGQSNNRNTALIDIAKYKNIKREKKEAIHQQQQIKHELRELQKFAQKTRNCENEIQNFESQLASIEVRLSSNSVEQCKQEIEDLNEQMRKRQEEIHIKTEEIDTLTREINEMEETIREYTTQNQQKKKEKKLELKKLKEKTRKLAMELRELHRKKHNAVETRKQMEEDIEQLNAEISSSNDDLKKAQEAWDEEQSKGEDKEREIEDKQKQLKKIQENRTENLQQIQQFEKGVEKANSFLDKATRKMAGWEEKLRTLVELRSNAQSIVNRLLEENQWLEEEKDRLGTGESPIDINYMPPGPLAKKLERAKAEFEKLKTTVNMTIQQESSNILDDIKMLNKRVEEAKQDLENLDRIIDSNEIQKKKVLEDCFDFVNGKFSEIFSLLYESATATLIKANDQNLDKGISFCVRFGDGEPKTSLSELSGGQRTLLSLSYIFALQKFNPAPIYIMDEVDAALDDNHVNDIGTLLKNSFKESQFVVVTHRPPLSKYAKVRFETRLEGTITNVLRHFDKRGGSN